MQLIVPPEIAARLPFCGLPAPTGWGGGGPLARCWLWGPCGETHVKWPVQARSLAWHLGLLILGPGSFHLIIPQPHSLPCCCGNKNRGWRKLLLCRTIGWPFPARLVYPLLTATLQAWDLVPECGCQPAQEDNRAVVQLSHPLCPPKLCCLLAFL